MRRDWPLLGCVFLAAFVASRQLVVLLLAPPGHHHGPGHGGPHPHGHGAHQRCAPPTPSAAPPAGQRRGARARRVRSPAGTGATDAGRRRPPGGHGLTPAGAARRLLPALRVPAAGGGGAIFAGFFIAAGLDATRAEDPSAADGGGWD